MGELVIKSIRAMTCTEYRYFSRFIPRTDKVWLLNDDMKGYMNDALAFVEDGIDSDQAQAYAYIRPIIVCENMIVKIGEKADIGGFWWTAFANDAFIMQDVLEEVCVEQTEDTSAIDTGSALDRWIRAWGEENGIIPGEPVTIVRTGENL